MCYTHIFTHDVLNLTLGNKSSLTPFTSSSNNSNKTNLRNSTSCLTSSYVVTHKFPLRHGPSLRCCYCYYCRLSETDLTLPKKRKIPITPTNLTHQTSLTQKLTSNGLKKSPPSSQSTRQPNILAGNTHTHTLLQQHQPMSISGCHFDNCRPQNYHLMQCKQKIHSPGKKKSLRGRVVGLANRRKPLKGRMAAVKNPWPKKCK